MKKIPIRKRYLLENEIAYSKEERNAFLESVKQFTAYKNDIYRSNNLREITQQIGNLISAAEGFTIKETDGWFDNITTNRDIKRLKESYKVFEQTSKELTQLQQRLESCYEDIGSGLARYYDV
jgi:hypothetical protein